MLTIWFRNYIVTYFKHYHLIIVNGMNMRLLVS